MSLVPANKLQSVYIPGPLRVTTPTISSKIENPIPVDNITPVSTPTLPQPVDSSNNYFSAIQGNIAAVTQPQIEESKSTKSEPSKGSLEQIKSMFGLTPDQNLSDLIQKPQKVSTPESSPEVQGALSRVNDWQAQLQALQAEANIASNQLASQAAGKDVTSSFLGKQQQEIGRQLAIKSAPIAAALASAQRNYETAYNIAKSSFDSEADYQNKLSDYNINMFNAALKVADAAQTAELNRLKTLEEEKKAETNDVASLMSTYASAYKDQPEILKNIASIKPSDPEARTKLSNVIALAKPIAKTGVDMNTRQSVVFNQLVTKKDKISAANNTFKVVEETSDRLLADPKNAQLQLSVLYQYVKVLDSNSAVREGETQLAKDTRSLYERIQGTIQGLKDGSLVGTDAAVKMAKEAKALAKSWQNATKSQLNSLSASAKVNGISDEWNTYNSTLDTLNADNTNSELKTGSTGKTSSGLSYTIE